MGRVMGMNEFQYENLEIGDKFEYYARDRSLIYWTPVLYILRVSANISYTVNIVDVEVEHAHGCAHQTANEVMRYRRWYQPWGLRAHMFLPTADIWEWGGGALSELYDDQGVTT